MDAECQPRSLSLAAELQFQVFSCLAAPLELGRSKLERNWAERELEGEHRHSSEIWNSQLG